MRVTKVRPEGGTSGRMGVVSDGSRNGSSDTQNHRHLQRGRWYPTTKASRLNYDWRANWQQIGQIATKRVLPLIEAARELDRKVRAQLKLPFVEWDG